MTNTAEFQGRWALITGASAGIGAAMARELARCGANVILTARRKDRLDSLAVELLAQGTEVRIVDADLNDPAAAQQIYEPPRALAFPLTSSSTTPALASTARSTPTRLRTKRARFA
jgi:short-subunit dehydrogenase